MRALFLFSFLLILSSCANVRDNLGLNRNAPDEFKVITNAPLEIPPSLSQLPSPQPGAPRPQETEIVAQAKATLLGNKGTQAAPSQTERLLLEQAGIDNVKEDIRSIVDAEYNADDTSNESVTQRLLGIGSAVREDKSVLDPEQERKRLEGSQANE